MTYEVEMIRKILVSLIFLAVIALFGFNDFFRFFLMINWMHFSFLLLFFIGCFFFIKIFAKK